MHLSIELMYFQFLFIIGREILKQYWGNLTFETFFQGNQIVFVGGH